jgi:hypothetical protein
MPLFVGKIQDFVSDIAKAFAAQDGMEAGAYTRPLFSST